MKINELLEETPQASKLVQVLRTVIGSADAKGTAVFLHFDTPKSEDIKQGALNLDLNRLMQNVGGEQFDYGTFKAAYDTDARVKTMVQDFNDTGVTPKTSKLVDKPEEIPAPDQDTDKVSQMAKRATDVGDSL